MESCSRRAFWLFILRGGAAVLLGLLAFLWPDPTLLTLAWLFGTYALADGLAAAYLSSANRKVEGDWWETFFAGLLGVSIGLMILLRPHLTWPALLLLIGARALLDGALEIAFAFRVRGLVDREWLIALAGVLSMLFGLVVIAVPLGGVLELASLIAAYATLFGLVQLALVWRVPQWRPWRQRDLRP
jgi:uncharacterized membrane protein HdeD (DUF308 family)